MTRRSCLIGILLLLVLLVSVTTPVSAQILSPEPRPLPFPVLAGAEFRINPQTAMADRLFRVENGTLFLCSDAAGGIDIAPYCRVPDRHWGPVSVVSCELTVSGRPPRGSFALPSRIALSELPKGSAITLRMLVQAPLIILDLQGNPTAVLDTFVEEYRWVVADVRPPLTEKLQP
jgi:hypothetical protein